MTNARKQLKKKPKLIADEKVHHTASRTKRHRIYVLNEQEAEKEIDKATLQKQLQREHFST